MKKKSIYLLRTIHGLFALLFIACIFYIYYSAFLKQFNFFSGLAILSLTIEGILVFLLNNGHCPLAPLQWKLGDSTPFFNLFLPERYARLAVPFFAAITFLGIFILIYRVFF